DVANAANLSENTHFVDNKNGLGQGEQETFTVVLNKPGSILANMVYTDAPASPDAAVALVNDLDLSLSGNGQNVAPNDHVNNHEVIELSNLPAGSYTLTVKASKVPQGKNGKQPYALVYTAREN
ncbi:MAG: S8 family serine peptidase, partial [Pseudobdellovibrionaceae bacterium]